MKKLKHKEEILVDKVLHIHFLQQLIHEKNIEEFMEIATQEFSKYTIEFYEVVGYLLEELGFKKVSVTREGDTNNRMDAIIIDESRSIPIEIKSPKEVEYVNVKSLRQALENKIILLSRKFYPTDRDVTSLVIAFSYPNERSGVYEIIDDIFDTYKIKIGILSFKDILKAYYMKKKNNVELNLEKIYYLKGRYNA